MSQPGPPQAKKKRFCVVSCRFLSLAYMQNAVMASPYKTLVFTILHS